MNMKDLYDPSLIENPKTTAEFWLALLRVRNHYLAEAMKDHSRKVKETGNWDHDHVLHTWLRLDFWLDRAFAEWKLAK